jgi:hypothetical protein
MYALSHIELLSLKMQLPALGAGSLDEEGKTALPLDFKVIICISLDLLTIKWQI